ncbi:Adenylate cyclase type 6 [Eumeta japonica]|uniref:Adenylate cyclase type 6 n=1 Tax=Eumeta variegata TaxID=151549 RepID=A0A4C2A4D5_EUMVA|nr:Adenylate cyclase type 6 [Eumeta japonica]
MLYQRYFIRMNQTNMTHLLGLLLTVVLTMMIVQIRTLIIAQNYLNALQQPSTNFAVFNRSAAYRTFYDPVEMSGQVHGKRKILDHAINATIVRKAYYEKERAAHITNVVILSLAALVYACLLAWLSRPTMNEIYLLVVSYIVFGTFFMIEIAWTTTAVMRSLSVGAGTCALFTYLTYATLSVRLHEATIGGIILAAVNITAHCCLHKYSHEDFSSCEEEQKLKPITGYPYAQAHRIARHYSTRAD